MKKKLFILLFFALYLLTACTPADLPVRKTEIVSASFSNPDGDTLVYYICQTTYYEEEPDKVTKLDTQALYDIFDPECLEPEKEMDIFGHPSALYLLNGRAYLCCTPDPEYTLVLEYSPDVVSEEDALKTMRSVFESVE